MMIEASITDWSPSTSSGKRLIGQRRANRLVKFARRDHGELQQLRRRRFSRCASLIGEADQRAEIVVELRLEPLPELERELVEALVLLEDVVGADVGRVATGIAAAEPALLEHRDAADTVPLRKVVGGGQPMPAAADDDGVIARLRLGAAPRRRPVPMPRQRVPRQAEERIPAKRLNGSRVPTHRCASPAA